MLLLAPNTEFSITGFNKHSLCNVLLGGAALVLFAHQHENNPQRQVLFLAIYDMGLKLTGERNEKAVKYRENDIILKQTRHKNIKQNKQRNQPILQNVLATKCSTYMPT